jgi:hypothetical protein
MPKHFLPCMGHIGARLVGRTPFWAPWTQALEGYDSPYGPKISFDISFGCPQLKF